MMATSEASIPHIGPHLIGANALRNTYTFNINIYTCRARSDLCKNPPNNSVSIKKVYISIIAFLHLIGLHRYPKRAIISHLLHSN